MVSIEVNKMRKCSIKAKKWGHHIRDEEGHRRHQVNQS